MGLCLIAVTDLGPTRCGVILQVALGLGFVIFVHELGHFAVAKWCGVQCDKFFVGFDIGGYKLSRKWGETEYGIGILPLGGYVKMMGQDDNPGNFDAQLAESRESGNFARREADHRSARPKGLRRSAQLHGQERAAADGDHLGRRDYEHHLRGDLRVHCVRRRRA